LSRLSLNYWWELRAQNCIEIGTEMYKKHANRIYCHREAWRSLRTVLVQHRAM